MTSLNKNLSTKRLSLPHLVILALIVHCFQESHAQPQNFPIPTVWLNHQPTLQTSGFQGFIGNYEFLNPFASSHYQKLKEIASKNSGSLFMVVRVDDSIPKNTLMQIGPIKVFQHGYTLNGRQLNFPIINNQSIILKYLYQSSPRRPSISERLFIDSSLKIAEVIYFEEILTTSQARVIESYLALKYSVNITNNIGSVIKDYLDLNKNTAWYNDKDAIYDQEVMAIGRLDFFNFYQSQTFTADQPDIQISLSPTSRGQMPNESIPDSTLLILSKLEINFNEIKCGSMSSYRPWKLRVINGPFAQKFVYLRLDTLLGSAVNPRLSDGNLSQNLMTRTVSGKTELSVPISQLNEGRDYFIVWDIELPCTPYSSVLLHGCNNPNTPNSIEIGIEPEGIPAILSLLRLSDGKQLDTELTEVATLMDQLEPGQYQLRVQNKSTLLVDQVLVIETCEVVLPLSGNASEVARVKSGSLIDNPTTLTNPGGGITPRIIGFPNPASENQEVTIELQNVYGPVNLKIFGPDGRLLSNEHLDITNDHHTHQFTTSISGSYLIQCSSEKAVYTQTLVVQ